MKKTLNLKKKDDANEDNDDEDELDSQFADDDAMVEVTVDGKVVQQSVKELKRLAGQEASLTRKSQETASKRKEADEAINKNHAVFQTLLAKAEEKYKPYAEVDMLLASKTMEAEDFALLRKEAQDAGNDSKFLREEADKFYQMSKHKTKRHYAGRCKASNRGFRERHPRMVK